MVEYVGQKYQQHNNNNNMMIHHINVNIMNYYMLNVVYQQKIY